MSHFRAGFVEGHGELRSCAEHHCWHAGTSSPGGSETMTLKRTTLEQSCLCGSTAALVFTDAVCPLPDVSWNCVCAHFCICDAWQQLVVHHSAESRTLCNLCTAQIFHRHWVPVMGWTVAFMGTCTPVRCSCQRLQVVAGLSTVHAALSARCTPGESSSCCVVTQGLAHGPISAP